MKNLDRVCFRESGTYGFEERVIDDSLDIVPCQLIKQLLYISLLVKVYYPAIDRYLHYCS
jgi:hypothetical protein